MARLIEGMGSVDVPTRTQDCVESDLSTLKCDQGGLPRREACHIPLSMRSCVFSYHLAEGQNPMEESCWFAHVSTASSSMCYEDMFKKKMLGASKIPMQDFLGDLRYRQYKVWREANALTGSP
eukprot:1145119-Pelagomonas_calceolata.AAC.6